MTAGFDVDLYDLDGPSARYATWRLRQDLGCDAPVRPLARLPAARYDLAYAVDVLEHSLHPAALAQTLFRAAAFVCVNLFEHDADQPDPADMHYPLNHWRLLPVLGEYGTVLQLGISGETIVTLWQSRLLPGRRAAGGGPSATAIVGRPICKRGLDLASR